MLDNGDIIRISRGMERVTGVPASQFRRALRSEVQQQRRQAASVLKDAPPTTPPPAFGPSRDIVGFQPKPFVAPPVPPQNQKGPTEDKELLEDVIYLDIGDDAFRITNIYTDGRRDAP